jgi:phage-related protein
MSTNIEALKVYASVGVDLSDLRKGIKDADGELSKVGAGAKATGLDKFVGEISSKLKSVGAGIAAAGGVLTGAFTAPVAFAVKAASDLSENLNKVQVVFGQSASKIQEFSKTTATSLGISQSSALEVAGTFGNLFAAMKIGQPASAEMSVNLVKLAADLASFNNIDPTDALEKLRAGLTGEAEPLKAVGILLNETQVKAKAAELGFKAVGGQLTEQQKVAARYAIIMEQSATAQGDFANTSTGLANATRIAKAQLETLAANLGSTFLPYVNQAINYVNGLFKTFQELPAPVQKAITIIAGVGAVLGPVLVVLGGLVSAVGAALPVITAIGGAIAALASPVGIVIAAIAALSAAYYTNFAGIGDAVDSLVSELQPLFQKLVELAKQAWEGLKASFEIVKPVLSGLVTFVGQTLSALIDVIRAVLKAIQGDWSGAGELLKSAASKIWTGIVALVQGYAESLQRLLAVIWQAIVAAATAYWKGVVTVLSAVWNAIKAAAISIWTGLLVFFTQTIPAALGTLLEFFASLPSKIGSFLSQLPEIVANIFGLLVGRAVALTTQLWEGVKAAYSTGVAFLSQVVSSGIEAVVGFFSSLPGRLVGFATSAWEAVKSAFSSGVQFAIKTAVNLYNGVSEWVSKLPELFTQIWTSIVDYITGLPGRLLEKAKAIGAAIWNGFRQGLDVHSPSGPEKEITAMAHGILVTLETEAPKMGKAAGKMAAAIDKAFKDALTSINEYIQSLQGASNITEQIFDRLTPKVRQKLKEQADAYKDLKERAEILRATFVALGNTMEVAFENGRIVIRRTSIDAVSDLDKINKKLGESQKFLRDTSAVAAAEAATLERVMSRTSAHWIQLMVEIEDETKEHAENARLALLELAKAADEKLRDSISHLKDTVGEGMGGVLVALLQHFGKLNQASIDQANKWAEGILQVVGNLPSKLGEKLRKATNTVLEWVNRIDQILKGLHKIFNQVPDGLDKVVEAITGIFKKSSKVVLDTTKATQDEIQKAAKKASEETAGLAGTAEEGSSRISKAFGVATAAVGAFVSGLTTANATGSKAIGSLVGGIQGALSGFAAGGPIGAVIGGIGGVLGGLFGGKSAAQKLQEKLQLERLKQDVQKGAQEVMSAAFETMQKALETFEKLADFTKTPKRLIDRFFIQMRRVIEHFIALAKVWNVQMLDAAKMFAESIGPILEAIAAGVEAFEKLAFFTGTPDKALNLFGAALQRSVELFIQISDEFERKAVKHAKKFASRAGEVVNTIGLGVEAFLKLNDYKGISAEIFDLFSRDLEFAVNKMIEVSDNISNRFLKQARRFSERALSIVALIKEGVDAFKGINEYQAISPEIFNSFLADLRMAVEKMQLVVNQIDTEMLSMASAFAQKSMAIFAAIKAGVEAFSALRDYKALPGEVLSQFLEDFKSAIALLKETLALALEGEDLAAKFQTAVAKIAEYLAKAGQTLAGIGGGAAQAAQTAVAAGAAATVIAASTASGSASTFTPASSYTTQSTRITYGNRTTHIQEGPIYLQVDMSKIHEVEDLVVIIEQARQKRRARKLS